MQLVRANLKEFSANVLRFLESGCNCANAQASGW
jgi:hypothetical protein